MDKFLELDSLDTLNLFIDDKISGLTSARSIFLNGLAKIIEGFRKRNLMTKSTTFYYRDSSMVDYPELNDHEFEVNFVFEITEEKELSFRVAIFQVNDNYLFNLHFKDGKCETMTLEELLDRISEQVKPGEVTVGRKVYYQTIEKYDYKCEVCNGTGRLKNKKVCPYCKDGMAEGDYITLENGIVSAITPSGIYIEGKQNPIKPEMVFTDVAVARAHIFGEKK